MGDEGKTVQTTQTADPWSAQQPYLKTGFERAQGLLDEGPAEYYPGQTVADTSGQTAQGQFNAFDQAGRAFDLNKYTIGGGFLDAGNPYFQGMANRIGQAIRPSIDSTFASTGRLGSGAHANAYASALADKVGNLAYGNYDTERARQIAAAQDYSAPQAMMGVGSQIEGQQQKLFNDALQRWNFAEGADQQALSNFMNLVGGKSFGGTTTSQQPYTGNSTMQGIGTGLAGLGALGQGLPGLLKLFGG